jgi:hypothetical protein
LRAYKLTIGVLGAFLSIVAASVSASYLAVVLFPLLLIVGGIVFMQAFWPTFRALLIGVLGASALAMTTAFYMSNAGNWNQRGMSWVIFVAAGGIALLGVNVFAIYVRYATDKTIAFFGGPILLMGSAAGYYWLLNVSAARADLYMFRADAICVGLYLLVGLACVVNRAQPGAGADAPGPQKSGL